MKHIFENSCKHSCCFHLQTWHLGVFYGKWQCVSKQSWAAPALLRPWGKTNANWVRPSLPSAFCSLRLDWTCLQQTKPSSQSGEIQLIQGHTLIPSLHRLIKSFFTLELWCFSTGATQQPISIQTLTHSKVTCSCYEYMWKPPFTTWSSKKCWSWKFCGLSSCFHDSLWSPVDVHMASSVFWVILSIKSPPEVTASAPGFRSLKLNSWL